MKLIEGDQHYISRTIQELHHEFNIDAINVRLHKLANGTWDRLRTVDPQTYKLTSKEDINIEIADHKWWPKVSIYVNQQQPEPKYYATF